MGVPTRGDVFTQLIEHLRKAQEASAMMAHLDRANGHDKLASLWLDFSEVQGKIVQKAIILAKRGMQ